MRVTSSLSCPKKVVDGGAPFAIELPFVYRPLLSDLICESPLETLACDDLRPGDLAEPFVNCAGDCDRFEASLSRRIVPSDLRLRFERWREGRPRVSCAWELSELSSSSERLCLRLPVVTGAGAVGVVVAAAAAAGPAGPAKLSETSASWVVVGAEKSGRAAVDGDGGLGGVSSARAKAGEGYPQYYGYQSVKARLPLDGSAPDYVGLIRSMLDALEL